MRLHRVLPSPYCHARAEAPAADRVPARTAGCTRFLTACVYKCQGAPQTSPGMRRGRATATNYREVCLTQRRPLQPPHTTTRCTQRRTEAWAHAQVGVSLLAHVCPAAGKKEHGGWGGGPWRGRTSRHGWAPHRCELSTHRARGSRRKHTPGPPRRQRRRSTPGYVYGIMASSAVQHATRRRRTGDRRRHLNRDNAQYQEQKCKPGTHAPHPHITCTPDGGRGCLARCVWIAGGKGRQSVQSTTTDRPRARMAP